MDSTPPPAEPAPIGPEGENAPLDKPLYGASFGQAIQRFFQKYAIFSGRASRSEYWWMALFNFIIAIVLAIISSLSTILYAILALIYGLGMLIPGLAVGVRRLHDANMSGWLLLLGLIPFIGGIILLVLTLLPSSPQGERFDAA